MCRETKTAGFCAGQNAGVMGCHFGSRNPTHLQNEPFFHTHPPFWVRNVCRSKETNDTWVLQLPNLTAANSRTQQLRQSNTTQKAAPLQLWGWDGWNQLSHITLHVSHQFLMESSLPSPMTARVYANIPEGKAQIIIIITLW